MSLPLCFAGVDCCCDCPQPGGKTFWQCVSTSSRLHNTFSERGRRGFFFFFGLLDDIAGAETLSRLPSGSFPHGCEGNTEENSQRCVAVARGGTVENRTRRKVAKGKQVVEKQATRTPTHPGAMRLGQQASSRPSQSHATPREISVSGLASWRNLFSVAGSEGGRSSYLMAPGGRCGTA